MDSKVLQKQHLHRNNEEMHPFINHLILEHMFNLCPVRLLKTCRRVSRLWNYYAYKYLRRSAVLFVWDHTVRHAIFDAGLQWNCLSMSANMIRIMKVAGVWPGGTMGVVTYLKIDGIGRIDQLYWEDFAVLMNTFPNLRTLVLAQRGIFFNRSSQRGNVTYSQLIRTITSMRNLTITDIRNYKYEDLSAFYCQQILNAMPNLKSFSLYLYDNCHMGTERYNNRFSNINNWITALRHARREGFMDLNILEIVIEEYGLLHVFPSSLVEEIEFCSLQLQKLSLSVGNHDSLTKIWKIVASQGRMLKTLKLIKSKPCDETACKVDKLRRFEPTPCWNLPRIHMPVLVELYLFDEIDDSAFHLLRKTSFCMLQKVTISRFFHRWECSSFCRALWLCNDVCIPTVNEFTLRVHCSCFSTKRTVQTLAKMFPNVVSTVLPLRNSAFRQVCKSWKHLQSLTMSPTTDKEAVLDDFGITGIRTGPRKAKRRNRKAHKKTRYPNITCLKNLRSLVINHPELRQQDFDVSNLYYSTLTTISMTAIKYGILECTRLEQIRLSFKDVVPSNLRDKLLSRFQGHEITEVREGGAWIIQPQE